MNPQIYKFGAVLLGGAAVGFGVGMLVGYKRGEKEAWTEAMLEIENVEDRTKRLYKVGEYASPDFANGEEQIENDELDPEQLEELKKHIEEGGYHQVSEISRVVEGNLVEKNVFDEFGTLEEVEQIEVEEVEGLNLNPNIDDPEPYIIDEADFQHDMETYEKIYLSWYTDHVLADMSDQVVPDPESTVGINNLNNLAPGTPCIWIRNNRLQADFEVTFEMGSYQETVFGTPPPIMERRGRKKAVSED